MARITRYQGVLVCTEAPARCSGRRCYHDLQDIQMHCYNATPCGRPLTSTAGRSYDPTRWGYAIGCTPCVQIDKMGRVERYPHHHYTTSPFNALDTVQDLDHPGATCRALGHSGTTRPWAIKCWVDNKNNQVHSGQCNTNLKNTQQYNNNSPVDVGYYAPATRTT
jgi:hypothetical protein